MSGRELVALGTSSQTPTRERSHNSYFLRWDDEGFVFDPGEGTQRQMTLAAVSACAVDTVCITHFHGDHCLGLPGLLQRVSLNACDRPLEVFYPESGQEYFDRLRAASIYYSQVKLTPRPVSAGNGELVELRRTPAYVLCACRLDHPVPTLGYRLQEQPRRHFIPSELEAAGISGPAVGQLARSGIVEVNGRTVTVQEVSVERPGSVFAFVMDTRPCAGAVALARDADLLVMESTYTSEHADLAAAYGHSTARQAAGTAGEAGAHRLAITHFSQRYQNVQTHLAEARAVFSETVALSDLDRVTIPRRR